MINFYEHFFIFIDSAITLARPTNLEISFLHFINHSRFFIFNIINLTHLN